MEAAEKQSRRSFSDCKTPPVSVAKRHAILAIQPVRGRPELMNEPALTLPVSVRCSRTGSAPGGGSAKHARRLSGSPPVSEESHNFLNDRLHAATGTLDKPVMESVDMIGMGRSTFTVQSPSPRTGNDCVSGVK